MPPLHRVHPPRGLSSILEADSCSRGADADQGAPFAPSGLRAGQVADCRTFGINRTSLGRTGTFCAAASPGGS